MAKNQKSSRTPAGKRVTRTKKGTGKNTGRSPRKSKKRQKREQPSSPLERVNSMMNWLIVLVAILPIVFSKVAMDMAITPRYMLLSAFCLLFAGYFFGIKKTPVGFPIPSSIKWVFYFGLGFGLWSLVSMFFSINLEEGYYAVGRHLLNLVFMVMVVVAVSREEGNILRLTKALVIVSIIQSIVGIFQYYGLAFESVPGTAKPYGLMANRNMFGSAQALLIPFLLYTWFKENGIWKYLSIIAIGGATLSVFLSQTRSAWLATLAILIIAIPSILFLVKGLPADARKKWIRGSLTGALGIVLLIAAALLMDRGGALSKSVSDRAKSLAAPTTEENTSSGSVNERLIIWGQCLELLGDHPILGVGPGNWKIAIPAYGSEGLVNAYGTRVRLRPHNVYLQVADETGVPGILLYIGMWAMIAFCGIKVIFEGIKNHDRQILSILMVAGLAALATDSFFSFPTDRIEHSVYIFLMGGIILGLFSNVFSSENTKETPFPKWVMPVFLLIAACNLVLAYAKYNYEVHMNRANAYKKKGNFAQVLKEAELAKTPLVTLGPIGDPVELHSSEAYKGMKQYKKALEDIHLGQSYHPNSARIYNNMGTIYTEMKQYDKAIEIYNRALEITPKYDIVLKNLAINYFSVGDYKTCLETLERVDISDSDYLKNIRDQATARL